MNYRSILLDIYAGRVEFYTNIDQITCVIDSMLFIDGIEVGCTVSIDDEFDTENSLAHDFLEEYDSVKYIEDLYENHKLREIYRSYVADKGLDNKMDKSPTFSNDDLYKIKYVLRYLLYDKRLD